MSTRKSTYLKTRYSEPTSPSEFVQEKLRFLPWGTEKHQRVEAGVAQVSRAVEALGDRDNALRAELEAMRDRWRNTNDLAKSLLITDRGFEGAKAAEFVQRFSDAVARCDAAKRAFDVADPEDTLTARSW